MDRPIFDLVADLRDEHDAIRSALEVARSSGSSSPAGREVLLRARHLMRSHTEKDERLVYPALARAAGSDPGLAATLQVLDVGRARVGDAVASLYWKLEVGASGPELARDVGRVRGVLLERMAREERVIYPEYERVRRSLSAAPARAAPPAADPPARRAAGSGA